jgi:type IV pilus modification protein PilV
MADNAGASSSRRTAASSSSRRPGAHDEGFSLVEVLVAMLIMTMGLLAVAQMLAVALNAETQARNGTTAARLAQDKLDQLMKADFDTSPQIQVTPTGVDTLNANVLNYYDAPDTGITRRWLVQAGPATTRLLTVRVLVTRGIATRRIVNLTTLVRRW